MGVGREMLLDSMSTSDGSEQEVTFSILRVKGGSQKQFPATETTIVQPGDVVTASTSNAPVVARPEAGIASSTSEPAL